MSLNNIDWMLTVLAVGVGFVLISFWRAQKRADIQFDLLDLLIENGRVSKIAVSYNLTFLITAWVIIHQEIKGTLTEGMFGLYGGMWVLPLVAKFVFNKNEMPNSTTVTRLTESSTTVVKDPLP